ncbi:Canalicular multispecific organic anion transporter 2 [Nymphon striatum]|nr:Canalicular multispecific organic anion transporter 2 [Nymphon striatum]
MKKGGLSKKSFTSYFSMMGWYIILTTLVFQVIGRAFSGGGNLWLSDWTEDSTSYTPTSTTERILVYSALTLGQALFVFFGYMILVIGTVRASKILHNNLVNKLFHAPIKFFDTTPLGRIINRLAQDMNNVDQMLPMIFRRSLVSVMVLFESIIIVEIETPIFIVVAVFMFAAYVILQLVKSVKGPEANETREKKYDLQEWMTFLTQLLGSLLVFLAALFAVLARSTLNPGSAALAITYSERITRSIDGFITSLSGLENGLVAVERILEYSKVEQEDAWKKVNNERKDDWPNSGEIEFKNFETKYRPNLDPVLKKISFKINPSEKIGICGRTGSGKSSLTLSLFRIIESTNGCIEIDGVDISKIGLHDLRSVLTIIPQDPVLFNGSLRINLDPFEKNTDEELWYVLELTNLKSYIDTVNNGLDYMIAENGENLSVGQRQLVCLARALLRKSKILVLDEATASVDLGTDDIIQETIRTAFKNHTVITIAHRLNTIMDSTRILVLEDGCIKEFDSPQVLLSNKDSSFYKLAKDANLV